MAAPDSRRLRRSRFGSLAALYAGLALCGAACSADAVREPEPTLDIPGTFSAVPREEGGYRLFRTRASLRFDPVTVYLMLDEHPPGALNLEHARRLAQAHDLALLDSEIVLLREFVRSEYQIVWYRSLNAEERE